MINFYLFIFIFKNFFILCNRYRISNTKVSAYLYYLWNFLNVSLLSMMLAADLVIILFILKNFLFTGCYGASQVALVVKNSPTKTGDITDTGLIPESGRSPGGWDGNPLKYSCLENPMDRGAWQAAVHDVAKSRTQLMWLSMRAQKLLRFYQKVLSFFSFSTCSKWFHAIFFPLIC